MYHDEMLPNYLVLTPDGVGSTYLQRALTVYLHSANMNYWNTHELLNGIGIKDGNLYKEVQATPYAQSLENICKLLSTTNNFLVSRIAKYHIDARLNERYEDYNLFYELCEKKFDIIVFCQRDPFEYALSWGIRRSAKKRNVYSINERIEAHGVHVKEPIDLDFFQRKLNQYTDYEYWAYDNFYITNKIDYNNINYNIDSVVKEITGLTHSVKDRFGISLQDYSRYRYLISMYKQTKDKEYFFNGIEVLDEMCNLHSMIEKLFYIHKLPTTIPIKMNTLSDKRSRITNFDQAVEIYNNWAVKGNSHEIVTEETIANKIDAERQNYAHR